MLVRLSTLALLATSALAYTIKVEDGRTFTWRDVANGAVVRSGESKNFKVVSRDGRPEYRGFVLDSTERGKFVVSNARYYTVRRMTSRYRGEDKLTSSV
jgi:hypothetical protein